MASVLSTTSTPSNFEVLFDAALDKYKKRTGQDLHGHPLASLIDGCDSPDAILALFQEQSRAFDEFRNGDPKLIKYLTPVVNGLHAISTSAALSAGTSFAFPPANVIFSGIGILLSAAKYVRASYDTLVDVFECIENFTRRLKIYTDDEIERTPAMTETIIKILVEILAVLAFATKQINQGRLKKFASNLLGEQDVESILQRLDRLTLEESKIAAAQTLDVVHGLVNNIEVVMEDGKASTDDIRQTLVLMEELVMEINKMKRNQLQQDVRRWLSAPDPWTNHNIARKAHHRGTASWFIHGDSFREWKSSGGLLWIQGLPGSGKTVFSSSIIEEVFNMRQMGLAMISFFYFDFRDGGKQEVRHLLSSILIQLCNQSDEFSEILSTFFEDYGRGSRQPSEEALSECLKRMITLSAQGALYLIVDALDECPNSSGYPSPRRQVLDVIHALINLHLPRVHYCVTSRPEIDIRAVLEPLATHNVQLHEQAGQKQDIIDFINYFLQSDPSVRRWREEDKQLAMETLTEKASGMFRWVRCQIESLSRCFPPSIRHILDELPETLDETYERILQEIDEEKKPYARRLFQCLVTSIRPLRVDELAELFAVLPNDEMIPGFYSGWRPENPEEFILSTCSTLVVFVKVKNKKIVQFSHFSVREYLTSNRIAGSASVCHFHVLPKPAHTLLAKACLSVLLQLDHNIDRIKIRDFPLALYAAKYWVDHALFEDVSSYIRGAMDCLFDKNKPHFAAWIRIFDHDKAYLPYDPAHHLAQHRAVPLYYAALCGFRDLVGRLLDAHPQDLNSQGGDYGTPLIAALGNKHPDITLILLARGADVEFRCRWGQTALYMASSRGYVDVVRSLIDHGADPNARCRGRGYDDHNNLRLEATPLLAATKNDRLEAARALLQQGADVNYLVNGTMSALHLASRHPSNKLAQLLLDHGANLNALDKLGETALHHVSSRGRTTFVTLFIEYGANVDARGLDGRTPLHLAVEWGHPEVARLLLDHGADVNARMDNRQTALHLAALWGNLQVMEVLLERGANLHAENDMGKTPLQAVETWSEDRVEIRRLLSERMGVRAEVVQMWD